MKRHVQWLVLAVVALASLPVIAQEPRPAPAAPVAPASPAAPAPPTAPTPPTAPVRGAVPAPQPVPAPAAPVARLLPQPIVPLDVQVVISRYQGDKKISSLPYSLAVNANEPGGQNTSALRMSSRVAIPSTVFPAVNGADPSKQLTSFQYESVGTNIDCSARTTPDEGRYQLMISIEDTSLVESSPAAQGGVTIGRPVTRQFKSTNTLVLREGQTRQFTAATDRVSGEVVKVDVTVKVVK